MTSPAPARPATGEPAIEARELTRRFGSFTAVDRVSFEVERGEIFGYLGANGAGKSTTIRMLTGLLTPSGGSGRVAGHDLAREPEAVKASIGYMSQKFSLYLDLPVRENVAFFGGAYGLEGRALQARADEVLELADLRGLGDTTTGAQTQTLRHVPAHSRRGLIRRALPRCRARWPTPSLLRPWRGCAISRRDRSDRRYWGDLRDQYRYLYLQPAGRLLRLSDRY